MEIKKLNEIIELKEIKSMGAYCSIGESFTINEYEIDEDDFGDSYDSEPENAEPYGCGNHVFKPKPATQKILNKYGITVDEYKAIAEQLEKELSFGACGWCV